MILLENELRYTLRLVYSDLNYDADVKCCKVSKINTKIMMP